MWQTYKVRKCCWKTVLIDLLNGRLPQISNLFKKKQNTVSAKNNKQRANKRGTLRAVHNLDLWLAFRCWQFCGNEPLTCRIQCHFWTDFLVSGKDTQLVLENPFAWGNTQHTHPATHRWPKLLGFLQLEGINSLNCRQLVSLVLWLCYKRKKKEVESFTWIQHFAYSMLSLYHTLLKIIYNEPRVYILIK